MNQREIGLWALAVLTIVFALLSVGMLAVYTINAIVPLPGHIV